MKRFALGVAIAGLLACSSCSAPKKVTYLVDADQIPTEVLKQANERNNPFLVPGDLLNIKVYASNMASVAQFNKGMNLSESGQIQGNIFSNSTTSNRGTASTEYYLVNSEGDIDFPVLGTINVVGKTKDELAEEIRSLIYPKYVTTPPTVEIRLMNFKVTILGAVNRPGVVVSDNERFNILEALASAGDLNIQGQRDNILLYRTNADGSHEVHRLNLNDRNLLMSPYFNLQQNDFIYVEPNRSMKQNSWTMPQAWTVSISVVSGLSSIAALVVGIINLSK